VKSEGSLSHLLVTVNDVTKRVMLSRELQESQEKAQAQLDLLLRILHVEPDSLTGFLTDADVSLKMVNSILKEPAREESAFRAKIDGIYRQVHAVKGEAAALGLKTVEQRAHCVRRSAQRSEGPQTLSGSDFLPLVVKLDDLFNHLAQVREMLSRLVDLHQAIARARPPAGATPQSKRRRSIAGSPAKRRAAAADKTMQLRADAARKRRPSRQAARAHARGSRGARREQPVEAGRAAVHWPRHVPEAYRRAVKDITIQLVRNAVVHGIEEPSERAKAHKSETARSPSSSAHATAEGYELVVQDDGRGLQLERIKEVAVERGLITPAQAAMLDPRQTMALIFRPGFSTADRVTTDAGRGAGMDLVRILVAELGGGSASLRRAASSLSSRSGCRRLNAPWLPERSHALKQQRTKTHEGRQWRWHPQRLNR
jgi:chemotaxis protein histidine kinase CheA